MTQSFPPVRLVEVVHRAVVWVLVWAAVAWLRAALARARSDAWRHTALI